MVGKRIIGPKGEQLYEERNFIWPPGTALAIACAMAFARQRQIKNTDTRYR